MGQRHSLNNTVKPVSLSHETVRSARTVVLKEGMPNTQWRTDYDMPHCMATVRLLIFQSNRGWGGGKLRRCHVAQIFLTHEELRAVTHRGRVNHLVQAKHDCKLQNFHKSKSSIFKIFATAKFSHHMVYMETEEQENWRMPWSINHVNDVRWTCRERSFSKRWTWNWAVYHFMKTCPVDGQ